MFEHLPDRDITAEYFVAIAVQVLVWLLQIMDWHLHTSSAYDRLGNLNREVGNSHQNLIRITSPQLSQLNEE